MHTSGPTAGQFPGQIFCIKALQAEVRTGLQVAGH